MARMGEKSSFLNSRAGRKPAVQLTARGAAKVGIAHLDVSKATTSGNPDKLVLSALALKISWFDANT